MRNRLVSLFGDECFGLFRREIGAEEIVNQRQVHGQLVLLATAHGAHRVSVCLHHPKTCDEVPDMFMLGVKDVRSIHMHHDARFVALREAVTGNMRPRIEHRDLVPCFSQLASHHST